MRKDGNVAHCDPAVESGRELEVAALNESMSFKTIFAHHRRISNI